MKEPRLRRWRRTLSTVIALIRRNRRVHHGQSSGAVPWCELKMPVVLLRLVTTRLEPAVFSASENVALLEIVPVRNVDSRSVVVKAVLAMT